MKKFWILGVVVVLVASGGVVWLQLREHHLTLRVPAQFASVTIALDQAQPGTVIEVDAAREPYLESLRVVTDDITLKSVNGRAVLQSQASGQAAIEVLANGVRVEGFEIRSKGPCVLVTQSEGSRVERNLLIGCEVGLSWQGSNGGKLEHNVIRANQNGIVLMNSSHNRICDNVITGNENNGVESQYSQDNEFCNNTIAENYAGVILGHSDNNTFSFNTIHGNQTEGIYLEASSRNMVAKNDVSLNDDGISVNLDSQENSLVENVARANRQSGIKFVHAEHNIALNNEAIGNEQGISLINAALNLIEHNVLNTNRDSGLMLQNSPQNTLRENDTFANDNGISLRSSENNMLVDNKISENTVGIYMSNSSKNSLQGNVAVSNKTGFEIGFSDNNLIKENRFNQHATAILLTESRQNIFVSNIVEHNQYGVNFLYSRDNILMFNVFEHQNETAISIINLSSNNLLSQNTIRYNKWGILLSGSDQNQVELNTVTHNGAGIVLHRSGTGTAIKGNWFFENDIGILVPQFLTKDETILSDSSIVLEVVGSDDDYLIRANRFEHNHDVDVRNDKDVPFYAPENLWDVAVTPSLSKRQKSALVTGDVRLNEARLKGPIFVTSADDVEQRILGAMVRLVLEAHGYSVVDMTNLGHAQEVFKAFYDNVVDVTWSNTDLALDHVPQEQINALHNERSAIRDFLAQRDEAEHNMLWLNCAPAKTSLGLAISLSSEFAVKSYGLDLSDSDPITISDVIHTFDGVEGTPIVAFPETFVSNFSRFDDFAKRYNLNMDKIHIKTIAPEQAVSELSVGSVDLALISNTAPEIEVLNLRMLNDDLNFFWKSSLCLVMRKEVARTFPQLVTLLAPLSEQLSLKQLRTLRGKVSFFGELPESVAHQFLSDHGFIP